MKWQRKLRHIDGLCRLFKELKKITLIGIGK